MYSAILALHIVVSLLLIAAVLLQSGKGSSMANVFGGGGMETVFGAETPAILNKITTVLAILFIATCLLLTTLPGSLRTRSILRERVGQTGPSLPAPAQPQTPAPVQPPVGR